MAKSTSSVKQPQDRDAILAAAYKQCTETVDQIVIDPELLSQFCDTVNVQLSEADQFDTQGLANRLMNLRKRGLLARKHRAFNGRNKPR